MITSTGSFGAVCLSRLTRLKTFLSDAQQFYVNDIQNERETIETMENTLFYLQTLYFRREAYFKFGQGSMAANNHRSMKSNFDMNIADQRSMSGSLKSREPSSSPRLSPNQMPRRVFPTQINGKPTLVKLNHGHVDDQRSIQFNNRTTHRSQNFSIEDADFARKQRADRHVTNASLNFQLFDKEQAPGQSVATLKVNLEDAATLERKNSGSSKTNHNRNAISQMETLFTKPADSKIDKRNKSKSISKPSLDNLVFPLIPFDTLPTQSPLCSVAKDLKASKENSRSYQNSCFKLPLHQIDEKTTLENIYPTYEDTTQDLDKKFIEADKFIKFNPFVSRSPTAQQNKLTQSVQLQKGSLYNLISSEGLAGVKVAEGATGGLGITPNKYSTLNRLLKENSSSGQRTIQQVGGKKKARVGQSNVASLYRTFDTPMSIKTAPKNNSIDLENLKASSKFTAAKLSKPQSGAAFPQTCKALLQRSVPKLSNLGYLSARFTEGKFNLPNDNPTSDPQRNQNKSEISSEEDHTETAKIQFRISNHNKPLSSIKQIIPPLDFMRSTQNHPLTSKHKRQSPRSGSEDYADQTSQPTPPVSTARASYV